MVESTQFTLLFGQISLLQNPRLETFWALVVFVKSIMISDTNWRPFY